MFFRKDLFVTLLLVFLMSLPGKAVATDITTRTIERVDHPAIEVKIEFPFIVSVDKAAHAFNTLVGNITHDWPTNAPYVQEEHRELPWLLPEQELCSKEQKATFAKSEAYCNSFTLEYKTHYRDNGLISIEFIKYWYLGGAHGVGQSYPLNFDFTTGEIIPLSSLFLDGSDYLAILAQESNQRMEDADCLIREVRADKEDFSLWFFNQDGLIFHWPAYWLGGYACGSKEVTIPYTSLSSVLNRAKHDRILLTGDAAPFDHNRGDE